MKYQTFFMMCIIAVLTFGCEVSHPVDPAYDNCRQAGGTWKDQKCLCPNDVNTVCRNNKLFTCSYGVFDQGIDCPGVCKDDKSCVLELDNECDESGYTCNYTNINDQNLYKCDGENLILEKACTNGCVDNKCVSECDKDEKVCVGMYKKDCENGFWSPGKFCPWGCAGDSCKCPKDGESICYNNTKYECHGTTIKEVGLCNNTCNNGELDCTDGGMLLVCENDHWPSETDAVSGICKDGILTFCENTDLARKTCTSGCNETGTSCNEKPECENIETPKCSSNNKIQICEEGKWKEYNEIICKDNISYSCNNGSIEEENCPNGCENGACNTTGSEPIETCDESIDTIKCEGDSIRYYCKNGKWQEHRIDNSPLCIFNDNLSKSYLCENDEFEVTICQYGCNKMTGSCNDFNCNSILTDGSFTYLEVTEALFRMFGDIEQYANLLKKLNESIISEFSDKFDLSCNGKWLVFEFENKLDSSKMKYLVINFFNEDRSNPSESENCEEDSNLYTILDSTEIPLMDAEYSSCDFNKVLLKLFADESYLLSSIQSCTEAKLSVPDRTIMNCGSPIITYLEQLDIKKKCDNDNSLNFEVSLSGSSESGSICR